jgi:hypothetical protein
MPALANAAARARSGIGCGGAVSRTEVDGTTVRQPSEGGGAVAEEKLLTLTVLLHPEPSRIEGVAFLDARARVSRNVRELRNAARRIVIARRGTTSACIEAALAGEILTERAAAGGDIDQMAAALEVSRPGLVLRTRELGLEGGRGRA